MLSAFALAQPLFNLLSDNPEFFAARGSTASEIIVFGVLLVLVPPAILLAIELLVGLVSEPARQVVHLVFIAGLAAVVFVQALKKAIDAGDAVLIVLALALGAAGALLYHRAEPVRSFLSVLSPAPILFLVLFLFFSDVSKIVLPEDASAKSAEGVARVPVVMVVFDEVPSTSLMDEKGGIDAKRYPAFARLAKDATFFKNAHSVYDSTSRAVPAIMDGNKPVIDRRLPTASEHPNSIFTLLGESHTMNVSEEATSVCPRDLCEDARLDEPFVDRLRSMTEDIGRVYAHVVAPPGIEKDLPTVSESWGDFGGGGGGGGAAAAPANADQPDTRANLASDRKGRFDAVGVADPRQARDAELQARPVAPRAVAVPARRPPVPPHRRRADPADLPPELQGPGAGRPAPAAPPAPDRLRRPRARQGARAARSARHLRRRADRRAGRPRRVVQEGAVRPPRREPRQHRRDHPGAPVHQAARTGAGTRGPLDSRDHDVLPTIADVLGAKLPEKVDGRSAFSDEVRRRTKVSMLKRNLKGSITLSLEEFERERDAELAKKVRLFGTGADEPERIYRIGPNQELIGTRATSAGRSSARASIADAGELSKVNTKSFLIPNWITGRVKGGENMKIAIAVNGTIRATGNTFKLATGGGEIFGAMVPPVIA